MGKKVRINRRRFLLSSSAAALATASLDGDLLASSSRSEQRSPQQSSASSQQTLRSVGPQRSFWSDQAPEVAFPIGGIGTGTVSIGSRGELRDWEIFNRPAKGRMMPFSFVALWAQPEGETASVRVVEGPLRPPFDGWNGFAREAGQGLPHFQRARFTGAYPFASVEFEDSAIPVSVTLEAYNPFIPLDVDDSSLPVAIFNYRLTNHSKKAVDIALAFSLLNPVGYDGKAFLKGLEDPGFGKNVTTQKTADAGGRTVGGLYFTSDKYDKDNARHGSLALLTTSSSYTAGRSWESGKWWDSYQRWIDEFSSDGRMHDSVQAEPTAEGTTDCSTLAPYCGLRPGEIKVVTFILSWYFPVRENYWHTDDEDGWDHPHDHIKNRKLNNYYGTRFKNAWEVAIHTAGRLRELEERTRLFTETLFGSTLPSYVLEAVSSQASILRTNTCMLLEGKQFFGFEGCGNDGANGWMNCSHVWNYEQAVAFLFPDLERSMRNTDFLYEVRDDNSMAFRSAVPLGIDRWDFRPAADGQMGCILKLYREWQISGDLDFLNTMWPNAKRSLEFAWSFWDSDKDGIMEGEQHNTYDIEFFGANPMTTTMYLGALRAGERMATAVGDLATAAQYKHICDLGVKNFESMWNGSFYVQKMPAAESIRSMPPYDNDDWKSRVIHDGELKYQFGAGCLSDQMLGQWFADVVNLDIGLDAKRIEAALQSIFRHNFKNDFWTHINTQRIYAVNDEKGLLLCSWPNGGRPSLPFVYADEVWTGVEYQVAAHLIYRGRVDEGLTMVKAISDRYDGARRNPWNQIEWGNHYARAMASYALLLALSGFYYSAVERTVGFSPKMNREKFNCFFAAGSAWGRFTQQQSSGKVEADLEVLNGAIVLKRMFVGNAADLGTATSVTVEMSDRKLVHCKVLDDKSTVGAEFSQELYIQEGDKLRITFKADLI